MEVMLEPLSDFWNGPDIKSGSLSWRRYLGAFTEWCDFFDANVDTNGNASSPKSALRHVDFTGNTSNQVVAFSPITLQPDTWYNIAQGSLSTSTYLNIYLVQTVKEGYTYVNRFPG